ncbi:MAG TPA: DUF4147 domain-containing protein [Blastocatellia bacterium]|nr:DUF4147 domain-containing protein [Blastocatellia bacterium]
MTGLQEIAKRVFLETLQAIEPDALIRQALTLEGNTLSIGAERIDLSSYTEIVMVGMGKACLKMAAAVEGCLGERIGRGILVTDRRAKTNVRSQVIVAGHPLPDANSLVAGEQILELVNSCGDDTLLIFLISGGGSALVEFPLSRGISLGDLIRANRVLTRCGASIREVNIIRKHLSRIKGGRLGYLARNSKVVAFVVSDVNEGDMPSVASNPLLPEDLRPEEVFDIANRFHLMEKLPPAVCHAIRTAPSVKPIGNWTWGSRQPIFRLLLENSNVLEKAAAITRGLGFRVEVDAEPNEDDYERVASRLVGRLLRLQSTAPGERVCVISGGEVLCPVRGDGVGGRNQEFVLYSARLLAGRGLQEVAVLSCGTDGIDGNSSAAGAVASGGVGGPASQPGEYASVFISTNDSHSFFNHMGGLVVTGPTGNNARDLRILMAKP